MGVKYHIVCCSDINQTLHASRHGNWLRRLVSIMLQLKCRIHTHTMNECISNSNCFAVRVTMIENVKLLNQYVLKLQNPCLLKGIIASWNSLDTHPISILWVVVDSHVQL